MAMLELDWIDLENNYDELREWMDNHGLSDHALVGGLKTFVVKKNEMIIAVIQEREVTISTAAIDTSLGPADTHRIGQALKSISGYKGGVNLLIVQEDSPSHAGASKIFRKLDGTYVL